jgi:hypothetical protein
MCLSTLIARRLNKVALEQVIYAPLGFFLRYQAWRENVTGIVPGPLPSRISNSSPMWALPSSHEKGRHRGR